MTRATIAKERRASSDSDLLARPASPTNLPLRLFAIAVAIGIGLRTIQYFANTSLWLDELAFANNLSRSAYDLMSRPLDYAQVAPPGFVLFEKGISTLLGVSELTLRLWSLVMGCAAVILSGLVTARIAGRWFAYIAASLVALAPDLIWQSAQVKPYSGDVALTLLLAWLMLRDLDADAPRPGRALIIACIITPWFSFAALFAVAAVGIAWLVRAQTSRHKVEVAGTRACVAGWAIVCLAVGAVARGQLSPATGEFMQGFWASTFPPHGDGPLAHATWAIDSLGRIMRTFSGGVGGRVVVLLAGVGAIVVARRSFVRAITMVVPVCIAVLTAGLRMYPLAERVALWAGPFMLVLAVTAVAAIAHAVVPRRWPGAALLAPVAMLVIPMRTTVLLPPVVQRIQDIKPVFRHITDNARPGDVVYVYYTAWQATTFYRAMLTRPLLTVAEGACSHTDRLAPIREIDALRDHPRIWVVFSHTDPVHRDTELILGYLDAIGTRRDVFAVPQPFPGSTRTSSAILYQLDPAMRARVPDLARWLVSSELPAAPKRGCFAPFAPTRMLTP